MAEPTHIGRAYVFGLDGAMSYVGVATAANELRSMEYRDEVGRIDVQDKKGETVGVLLFNPNPKITITFYPCAVAGPGAISTARTNSVMPARGSKVALTGFPPVVGTAEGAINSAKWLYFGGGSYRYSFDGILELTLPLEKFLTDLLATDIT